MDSRNGEYCSHIESKLPRPSYGSVKASLTGFIDRVNSVAPTHYNATERQHRRIEKRLLEFGLSGYEVELVMSRVVDQKPMADIVKESGWVSASSAAYYLRVALRKLRNGGFKP